jgi:peptidylprolyl isomerase
MVQAKNGDTVKVHYTGRLGDGTVFDSSQDRAPLEFTLGQRRLIPGFETGVLGMEPGESKTISIPSDQAYGPRDPDRVIEVNRNQMPPQMPLRMGARVQGTNNQGQTLDFRVIGLSAESVTLDGNHPLAGRDLTFDITLVEIV